MWLGRNAPRLLFSVFAAWAVVMLFGSELFEWIPETRRETIESLVVVAVVVACFVSTWLVSRRWPGFLALPRPVSAGFVLTRTVGYASILVVALAVFFAVVEFVNLRLTGDPDNPQYGVSVVFAIIWYPAALAPILTLLAVWRAAKKRVAE